MTLIILIAIFKVSIAVIIIVTNSIALVVIVIVVMITNISSTVFSNNSYDYDHHHYTLKTTMRTLPPDSPDIQWLIKPIHHSYLRIIDHSDWSCLQQLSYGLKAPHCNYT